MRGSEAKKTFLGQSLEQVDILNQKRAVVFEPRFSDFQMLHNMVFLGFEELRRCSYFEMLLLEETFDWLMPDQNLFGAAQLGLLGGAVARHRESMEQLFLPARGRADRVQI